MMYTYTIYNQIYTNIWTLHSLFVDALQVVFHFVKTLNYQLTNFHRQTPEDGNCVKIMYKGG